MYIMFDKTKYMLLIREYMDKHQVSYTSARHLIALEHISYDYNISMY